MICGIRGMESDMKNRVESVKGQENASVDNTLPDRQRLLKKASYILPAALFLAAILVTVYYIAAAARGEFHSDCTDTIFWANASYESGHIYNADFAYACLLPFGTNLLMLPFFPFFGLSMTTHVLGMLLFFILFTVFFCLMLHEMGWGIRSVCVGGAIFLGLLSSSAKMREMFWGHTIYYSLGILFLFMGTYFYFRFENLLEKRRRLQKDQQPVRRVTIHVIITAAALLLFLMFSATDGISALSIFGLPFLAAIFAVHIADNSKPVVCRQNLCALNQIMIFTVMILLGIVMNELWAGDITAGYESAYSRYSAQSSWTEHVQKLPLAWLTLLGVEDLDGQPMMSAESVKNIFHILGAMLIAVFPIIATCFYFRYPNDREGKHIRLWIWIHWAVTTIILLGYVFGKLSAANWRLIPIAGTGMILMLLVLRWAILFNKPSIRIPALLAIPVVVLAVLNLITVAAMPKDAYKENEIYELAEFLEKEDLSYGYATFWRANAITVISGPDVKVRSVEIDDTGIMPGNYQTQKSWYQSQEGQEEYFLLVNQSEYDMLGGLENSLLTEAAQCKFIQLDDGSVFYILIFAHNIF